MGRFKKWGNYKNVLTKRDHVQPCCYYEELHDYNLQAESFDSPKYLPATGKMDDIHFKECLIELLQDMFGEESVPKIFAGDTIKVTVDNKDAIIWLNNMTVQNWLLVNDK